MTAPTRVRSATATIDYANGENIVTVSWQSPVNPGSLPVTRYRIQYSVGGQSWGAIESISYPYTGLPTNANSRSITHTLKTGVPFLYKPTFYRVSAITGAEQLAGPWVIVGPVYATTDVPSSPTIETLTPNGRNITLNIVKPTFEGTSQVTSYNIQYRVGGSDEWTSINGITRTSNEFYTSYTVSGLTIGATYQFRVAAVNNSGAGTYSTIYSKRTSNPAAIPEPIIGIPTAGSPVGGCDLDNCYLIPSPKGLRIYWRDNHYGPLAINNWLIRIRQNNFPPYYTLTIPNSNVLRLSEDNRIRYYDIYNYGANIGELAYQVQIAGQTADGSLGFSPIEIYNARWTPTAPTILNVIRSSSNADILVQEPAHTGLIRIGARLFADLSRSFGTYFYDIEYRRLDLPNWTRVRRVVNPPETQNTQQLLSIGGLNPAFTYVFRVSLVSHVDTLGSGVPTLNGPFSSNFVA